MKRQLVPFILGFLIALIAAISAVVMSAGRAAADLVPAVDSLGVSMEDSIDAGDVVAAMTQGSSDIGVPAMLDVSYEQPAKAMDSSALPQSEPAGATSAPPAELPPALSMTRDSVAVVHERRLARTFGAMSSRDAARVLEQMSDSDVATVLGYLTERQSA